MISFFLVLKELVDLLDVVVGELLDIILELLRGVLGDVSVLVLAFFLDVVVDVPPDVPDGHAAVLGELFGVLHDLVSPLLGEGRDGQTDDLAVIPRVETDV